MKDFVRITFLFSEEPSTLFLADLQKKYLMTQFIYHSPPYCVLRTYRFKFNANEIWKIAKRLKQFSNNYLEVHLALMDSLPSSDT